MPTLEDNPKQNNHSHQRTLQGRLQHTHTNTYTYRYELTTCTMSGM